MIQPRLVWALAQKDLLLFLADRRGVLLCFGVPILLASVFGAVFHRPDDALPVRVVVSVVANDHNPLTQRIVGELLASDKLQASACDLAAR